MSKVVGFGDYLMHLSPEGYLRFAQANSLELSFTGAEANVLAALSLWGINTEFVTSVPKNPLAQKGVSFLKGLGIKTDNIYMCDGRMGLYFLEKGASLRSSGVIYDRENTCFCNSKYDDYNWESIFDGCEYFYLTGITPRLSENLYDASKKALAEAKKRGIKAVLDLNFRSKLGTVEDFKKVILDFAKYLDCLIINEEHAKMMFGITNEFFEEEAFERVENFTRQVQRITGIKTIAMPVRRTISASDARIYAGVLNDDVFALGNTFDIHVVDRVGSGDAFSAGLLYSLINGFEADKAVNFASASSALKHTVESDINYSSVEEIEAVLSKGFGDVKR